MNHVLYIIPILLAVTIPNAFAEVGQNYDTVINEDGITTWTSHAERILNGTWQNYFLETDTQKIIFKSNSIGGLIYDIDSCSYSLYENGYDGDQVIPSVSTVATYLNNDQWQNLPVNNESCNVIVAEKDNGIIIVADKILNQNVITDYINGTSITNVIQKERFQQELILDVNTGIKETWRVWNEGTEELGISQTAHVGSTIEIANQVIDIEQLNGQSFDRDFIINNEAEILKFTDSINYDFDKGIDSLTNVNIIHESGLFDNTYKINLDYANGLDGIPFVNYLEIDPTFTNTGSLSGSNWDFDLSSLSGTIIISSGTIDGTSLTSTQISNAESSVGGTWSTASSGTSYKVHSFTTTGSSSFTVTSGSGNVEYLVIGGGGGAYCGGGGSGDYRTATGYGVSTGSHTVTVGVGGNPGNCNTAGSQTNGGSSVFDSITSIGGGAGGGIGGNGNSGGSGGGAGGHDGNSPTKTGGSSSSYGNDGGDSDTPNTKSGGGGGASARGQHSSEATGASGNGGDGISSSITGTAIYRAGGGTGSAYSTNTGGTGGLGGGGNYDTNGVTNTGSGGGGAGIGNLAGYGGSGIVIISYPDDGSITATGGTITTATVANSSPSLSFNYVVATIPNSISNLAASFSSPNVDLTFSTPSNGGSAITSFKVYRDTGSGYSLYDTVSGSSLTSYQDPSPSIGVTNYYKINAVNSIGEANDSNIASLFVGIPPGNPTGLTSTIQDADNAPLDVYLQWSSPVSWGTGTAQGFEVYRNGVLITTTGLVNSYTDTVTQGSHSHYVKAVSTHGTSGNSNTANITTPNVPDAITDLSGSATSDTQINVTWTAPNDNGSNIDLYKIFKDGSQIDTTTNTNYSLTGLSSNTAYAITVYTNNSVGDSLVSNTENITTYQSVSGSMTVTPNIQGASTQLTFTASNITGTPTPTFNIFTLKEGSTVIASGVSSPYTLKLNDNSAHTYTITSTDNTHWDTPTISGNTIVTASYDPNWSNGISYNYTRGSGVMDLTVNKDSQSLWDAICNYKTTTEVLNDQSGIQSNHTNVWYISESQNIADIDTVYVSCNDDGTTLFSFTSFGPNRLGGGIAQLDDIFGDMTGTPVALIFVLLVAGLFTGRSAPTGILLVLALVGVLGFIGMLTIDEAVWGFLLLAGVLGIFLGKRFL